MRVYSLIFCCERTEPLPLSFLPRFSHWCLASLDSSLAHLFRTQRRQLSQTTSIHMFSFTTVEEKDYTAHSNLVRTPLIPLHTTHLCSTCTCTQISNTHCSARKLKADGTESRLHFCLPCCSSCTSFELPHDFKMSIKKHNCLVLIIVSVTATAW